MTKEKVIARYDCNILKSSGKCGILKPDENGYREITLGAFDCMASDGSAYYPMSAHIKKLFSESGELQRRAKSERLRGEANHPQFIPGMSLDVYLDRLREIRNELVSHHIKSPRLVVSKDANGKKLVLVKGLVKPSGVHYAALERSLANREEDTCFSLRSIVGFHFEGGKRVNDVRELVTWDWVSEPGMDIASKYRSAGLLSAGNHDLAFDITPEMLNNIDLQRSASRAGMLSESSVTTSMIRSAIGWEKVEVVVPGSMGWS